MVLVFSLCLRCLLYCNVRSRAPCSLLCGAFRVFTRSFSLLSGGSWMIFSWSAHLSLHFFNFGGFSFATTRAAVLTDFLSRFFFTRPRQRKVELRPSFLFRKSFLDEKEARAGIWFGDHLRFFQIQRFSSLPVFFLFLFLFVFVFLHPICS